MLTQLCWRRSLNTYGHARVHNLYIHGAVVRTDQRGFSREPHRYVTYNSEPTFIRRNPKRTALAHDAETESLEHNGIVVKEPKKRGKPKKRTPDEAIGGAASKDTIAEPVEDGLNSSKAPTPTKAVTRDGNSIAGPLVEPTAPHTLSNNNQEPHPAFTKPSTLSEPSITPGSKNHHDLPSFLLYAARTHLPPTSTVYTGTHYEYTVAASLARLGFTLTRTGARSDLGIDLIGTWRVPPAPSPIRVFVQCKALASGLFPQHARELMGAFAGLPVGWKENGVVLGLVASPGDVTKGVRDAVGRSGLPMGFLKVAREGRVEQFHWNRRAEEQGLKGMGVTLRYGKEEGSEPEVCLISGGWPVDFDCIVRPGLEEVEEETSEAEKAP